MPAPAPAPSGSAIPDHGLVAALISQPTAAQVETLSRAALAYRSTRQAFEWMRGQAARAQRGQGALLLDGNIQDLLRLCSGDDGAALGFDAPLRQQLRALLSAAQPPTLADLAPAPEANLVEPLTIRSDELTVIAGIPGSGKSTLGRRIEAVAGVEVIDVDQEVGPRRTNEMFTRAFERCDERTEAVLAAGQPLAWETTLVIQLRRWALLSAAERHGRAVHLIVLPADAEQAIQRVKARAFSGGHGVPAEAIRGYAREWHTALACARHEGFARITHVSGEQVRACDIELG